jgi:MFS family permease
LSQVFWQVGWSGLTYSIDVITADSTQLKNRGLAYAFTSSPYMITAFAGPKSAEAFLLNGDQWRWGFGTFSIVLPVVALPLYALLRYNLQKAKKQGLLVRQPSGRSFLENIKWGLIEFDGE